ncbi:unnamed protein product, partial [Amoebophrya sp. A25]
LASRIAALSSGDYTFDDTEEADPLFDAIEDDRQFDFGDNGSERHDSDGESERSEELEHLGAPERYHTYFASRQTHPESAANSSSASSDKSW